MKILMGLGNPGPEYEGTRHNVGFAIADRLVRRLRTTYSSGYRCVLARAVVRGVQVLVVKPMTYMNRSGEIIPMLLREQRVCPQDFLIMYDDMSLPVGRLRLRAGGSSGGHNGMKSVLAHMGTEGVPRLRVGIGQPSMSSGGGAVEHVLSRFSISERAVVDQVIDLAVEAALVFLFDGIETAMSTFNSKFVSSTGGADRPDR